ncbi:hypothetical protein ADK77_17905, partial [Streptomyces antibioticus]
PGLRVEPGFLDFNVPSVHGVLQSLAAEGGGDVVALEKGGETVRPGGGVPGALGGGRPVPDVHRRAVGALGG